MKILEDKYPKGTWKYQRSSGRYVDKNYYENLRILAKKIVDDMTFFAVCSSSTLEVGTGKSVFMTQTGEIWSHLVKEIHGIDVEFKMDNVVFKPKDLIERSFKVPKYSCILLDEWEDSHYWSELGMSLRQFFRKCRQLNLFIIAIIPNFFQLPMNYAISRSVFFVDVRFEGEFERGYFRFYNYKKKKELYMKGKKFHDYNVVAPDFDGRFFQGYGIDEDEYRKAKYDDMINSEEEEKKKLSENDIKIKIAKQFKSNCPEISNKTIARGFAVSERTIYQWFKGDKGDIED